MDKSNELFDKGKNCPGDQSRLNKIQAVYYVYRLQSALTCFKIIPCHHVAKQVTHWLPSGVKMVSTTTL
jgi:hypothetical protein